MVWERITHCNANFAAQIRLQDSQDPEEAQSPHHMDKVDYNNYKVQVT